jgi:hypothetical protein
MKLQVNIALGNLEVIVTVPVSSQKGHENGQRQEWAASNFAR